MVFLFIPVRLAFLRVRLLGLYVPPPAGVNPAGLRQLLAKVAGAGGVLAATIAGV
jgi:hypothetical protein